MSATNKITATTSTEAPKDVPVLSDSATAKPKPSFYKRPLPDKCIAFTSSAGKKVFASALHTNGLRSFFPLMEQFTTQSEPAYCGISTLVIVLNSLAVDPRQTWKGPWRWYHEGMLNCCISLEEVQKTGITLKDFACLAQCQGLSVDVTYCDSDDKIEDFRRAVRIACQDPADTSTADAGDDANACGSQVSDADTEPMKVLAVSYSRKVLGQTGSGHFSPVAAYDEASDKLLVLDTARFKYGAHWVDLAILFRAMQSKDPATDRSRGFALLSFKPVPKMPRQTKQGSSCPTACNERCACPQPVSLLFRSKMSAGPLRRDYKAFVQTVGADKLSWNDVYQFWSKNDDMDIWTVLEPLVMPTDCDDDVRRIKEMRQLLDELAGLPATAVDTGGCGRTSSSSSSSHCGSSSGAHITCCRPASAIFVVYLASISEQRRVAELDRAKSATNDAKTWLLNEARLVSIAIDVSDKTVSV